MNYVFLSYINRSGSTFLVNQFSKLETFCVCPEADILYNRLLTWPDQKVSFKKKPINKILKDLKFRRWQLSEKKAKNILEANYTNAKKFLLLLDLFRKTHFPLSKYNVFKYNYIIRLKPYLDKTKTSDSFFWISLHRNPLHVFASQRKNISPITNKAMSTNVLHFCKQVKGLESSLNKLNDESCLRVQFEALISDFSNTMSSIFNFLKIEEKLSNYSSVLGKIKLFMSPDYLDLHPAIDLPPDKLKIYTSTNTLSDFEEFLINFKLPTLMKSEHSKNLKFKVSYLLPILVESVDMFLKYSRQKLRKLVSRF